MNRDQSVTYFELEDAVMTDRGARIDLHDADDRTYEAAVTLAKEAFTKGVEINISNVDDRNAMRKECAQQNMPVSNKELQEKWQANRDEMTAKPLSKADHYLAQINANEHAKNEREALERDREHDEHDSIGIHDRNR